MPLYFSCSYITMLPGVEDLSGIRTFRVLRALRTISAVKGQYIHCTIPVTWGAFHSTQNSDLHFRKYPVADGNITSVSGLFDYLARYT